MVALRHLGFSKSQDRYDPVRGGDRDGGTVGERVGGGRKGPMDGGEREGKERRDGKWRYVRHPIL